MTGRVNQETNRVELRCDGCGVEAPPAGEIMAGHGLRRMGWQCDGGSHFCPACVKTGEDLSE